MANIKKLKSKKFLPMLSDRQTRFDAAQEKLPDFSALQNNLPEKNDAMIEARKQEYEKILRKLCFWYIPAYCITFLILDAFDIYRLTYERLIVHGAIIVITILPFVSELSMAGLRLKLREPEKEKKND